MSEVYTHNEERQNWKVEGSKDQPDMNSQVMPPKAMVNSWPGTKGHVCIHGCTAVRVCYHQRTGGHQGSRLPHLESCWCLRAMQNWFCPHLSITGEMALPLTSCSTQKSSPYIMPRKHLKLALVSGVAGEPAPKA